MQGQWIGRITGTNSGQILIDVDDAGDHWFGHALVWDDNPELPGFVIRIATNNKERVQHFTAKAQDGSIQLLSPTRPLILDWGEISRSAPELSLPDVIDFRISIFSAKMNISWKTNTKTTGKGQVHLISADRKSTVKVNTEIDTWKKLRNYALDLEPRRYIFRGQDCSKTLRTAFHRTRRKDLINFLNVDIPNAHHTLTARTRHLFDLNRPEQNGAFLNLLQHHGYPTPLLDWTYSPFVAGFFAYRHRRPRKIDDTTVRIFIFDRKSWVQDFAQVQSVAFAKPHFSILEALTIENARAMPQQALSSISNLDDIERYIAIKESETGKTYLEAVDLPVDERRLVMEQLSMMGITAGSLFPGLDGACEELRGRYFHPFS